MVFFFLYLIFFFFALFFFFVISRLSLCLTITLFFFFWTFQRACAKHSWGVFQRNISDAARPVFLKTGHDRLRRDMLLLWHSCPFLFCSISLPRLCLCNSILFPSSKGGSGSFILARQCVCRFLLCNHLHFLERGKRKTAKRKKKNNNKKEAYWG